MQGRHARVRLVAVLSELQTSEGDGSLAGAKMMLARAFARRCGAYLALAALTLQLALSFAHVHKHDLVFSGFDRC
jgi:hypothetical protein